MEFFYVMISIMFTMIVIGIPFAIINEAKDRATRHSDESKDKKI